MKKLILLLCLAGAPALAQDNVLLVAAASSSGTYHDMLKEISEFCSTEDLKVQEVKMSGGATDNLAALANNKVSVAFLHSDVIFAMAQSESQYKNLKTLVALYPEEIHVVARRNSGIKTGGVVGIGGKAVEFNSLADLKGYRVGAAGGGAITAKLLQGQGEAGFLFVQKDSGKELLPALDSGEIQAVIFVGGAPLANIEALDGSKYKLLPIIDVPGQSNIVTRVRNIYKDATLNYPNLRVSGAVRTLAADAIILTRQYKSARMVAPQKKFRECFYQHLDDLKETPGKHRKWQDVDQANHGTWDWYEIAGTTAATPETGPAPVSKSLKKKGG